MYSVPVYLYQGTKRPSMCSLQVTKNMPISCFLMNLNTVCSTGMYRCTRTCTGVLQLLLDRYTSGTHVIRTGSSRKSVVTELQDMCGTQYTTVLLIIFTVLYACPGSWILDPGCGAHVCAHVL